MPLPKYRGVDMHRRILPLIAPLAVLLHGHLAAQDVEMLAREYGTTVPAAYYAELRRNPNAYRFRRGWRSEARVDALGLRRPRRGGYWFPVPLLFAGTIILFLYVSIISAIGIEVEANVSKDLRDSTLRLTMVGITSLILAPFIEEVFFRGFLFGGLQGRWGVPRAALGSGLIFGLAHFAEPSSLAILPAIGMIGALFAWGYYYTGSLYVPIAAHFVWNLFTFIALATGAT
ncbi:MAG: CPBP family intramembrane metalloprotease [Gemmatimonadetes bacterium]|nr:CPBP family intramembrane metalloprotease [Gemmatimonadota bacterium]